MELNSHYKMPQIGLGTWQITGAAAVQAVKDALEIGYRHIDSAEVYKNEKEVGQALHAQIAAGIVKREDVFVTTKVWPNGSNQKKALQSIHESLKNFNLSYVDLVLLHSAQDDYANTYKGLEDAHNQKLTRSIGVSNFKKENIDHLLKTAKVKPAVNQIKINPTLHEDDLVNYCNKLNISVTGYSPLGRGDLVKNPTLTAIGKKYNKTASQVAIRWQIERGLVVIPKSTHKQYIEEDFDVFDFKLSSEDMNTIHKMH